jgi:hypothetical protein
MTELPFSQHDAYSALLAEYLKRVCRLMPAAAIGDRSFFKGAFSGAARTDVLLKTI